MLLIPSGLQGQECGHEVMSTIPFVASGSTCGAGNEVGVTNPCPAWYVSGEDYIYEFSVPYETCLFIEVSNFEPGSAGALLSTQCPTEWSLSCVDQVFSGTGATSLSMLVVAEPDVQYFLTITTYAPTAPCTDFDLSISTNCPTYNQGDCHGALNICEGYFYEEFAPPDNGMYPDDLPFTSCGMGTVDNEGWYRIDVLEDGILNFTLTPDDTDDYDWMLFNLTNAGCDAISAHPELVASCNSHGVLDDNGPTGISSAEGGIGNQNGPGWLNGPPFNADLPVFAGESYVLLVSNWSGTPNGYTLDFTASTAAFGDTIPPEVEHIHSNCEGLRVLFSEYIDCSTVQPEYFMIEGPGGPYTVTEIESNCASGDAFAAHFNLTVEPALSEPGGNFNLVFHDDQLADMCGNFLEAVEVPFAVTPAIDISAEILPALCGGNAGSFTVVAENATAPMQFSLDGGEYQSSPHFADMAPGTYQVEVLDAGGCYGIGTVEVSEDVASFTAGVNGYACDNSFATEASLPQGFTGIWSGPSEVTFDDPESPETSVSASVPGVYDLVWTITNNMNCTVSESIAVSFSDLGVSAQELGDLSCDGDCDGEFSFTPSGVADLSELSHHWSSGTPHPELPHTVTGLCAGSHVLTLSTDSGCVAQVPFTISDPGELTVQSIIANPASCPGIDDASIEVVSGNATVYSFDGGLTYSSVSIARNLRPGLHSLSVQDGGGCRMDTSVYIPPTQGPTAHFDAVPHAANVLTPDFQFRNLSINHKSSRWEFGYPHGLGFSHLEDPEFSFAGAEAGEYVVALIVEDEKGCSNTAYRSVTLYGDIVYFIPNSFTPNGDGINDVFKPVFGNIDESSYHIQIFDRWGGKVFESTDVNEGWRGDTRGNEYFSGGNTVYTYLIRVGVPRSTDVVELKGSITVVR